MGETGKEKLMGREKGREKVRGREGGRERDRGTTNMKNVNNRGIWVKDKQKFLVLLLQLLCKFEIIAKLKVPP